jgi:hypothetical protein
MLPDASGLLATTLPPDFDVPVQTLPPEGSMLPPTTGELVALPTGDIVFKPSVRNATDSATDGAAEGAEGGPARSASTLPVFALLPSPRLIQIRSVMEQATSQARAAGTKETERNVERMPRVAGTLSGQIFLYRGRAFLSPASFAPAAIVATSASPAQPSDAGTPNAAAGATPSGDAPSQPAPPTSSDLDKLFQELEGMPSAPRVLAPSGGSASREQAGRGGASPRGAAREAPLMQDGMVIVRRPARLVRMQELGGRLGLAFDNDASSQAAATTGQGPTPQATQPGAGVAAQREPSSIGVSDELPTMPLLPCSTLERMEQLAAQHADSLTYIVTGRIVSDGDRNAFMPLFFQARMPSAIVPGR